MAHINALEFARTIQDDCDRSNLVVSYDVQILDNTVVKIRVVLSFDAFIDVFYNADSGKCSYALIKKGTRVFGTDNAFIGWHIHPISHPDQHVPSSEVSFRDFLSTVEEHDWDGD
jgi:hypothetical protein